MPTFSTPRGTQDILPADWPYWSYVFEHAERVASLHGYRRIETPTFAETSLFARTSGEVSDIVDKEMYTFSDRGGDQLTLRPEGTAPVMRAYLQHGMHKLRQPVKLFYFERMFRYDRPQAGRFREHHQFGCEAIGVEDAYVDVEMIVLLEAFYRSLGLKDFALQVNTIGDPACRAGYVDALRKYLERHESELAPLDRDRLRRNPLRVLDSKERASQNVIEGAPRMVDVLCDACREHWDKLRHGLRTLCISYEENHRLVRGLDYYTRTVFEFVPPAGGSQGTLGAGGRYDALSSAMGAQWVPGVGFGTGIERLILALQETGVDVEAESPPDVFFVHVGKEAEDAVLVLSREARAAGLGAVMSFGSRSLNAQMKQANGSGARYAVLIGDEELASRSVQVRDLALHASQTIPASRLVERLLEDRTPVKS